MNPEFQRNLWIEMTTQRIALMAGILVLVFFAAGMTSFLPNTTEQTARVLFYIIVVAWGTRSAALSVVSEIRDRTWDFQRLSSISPAEMTWGKLFGSTVYNWFGGAICLVVMVSSVLLKQGIVSALIELVYAVSVGVVAQGVSFLASLIAVRRRQQSHSRRDVFLYQVVGVLSAYLVYSLWQTIDPRSLLTLVITAPREFSWWGIDVNPRIFFLISLALLLGWILTGCYRAMRIELKMQNRPTVWIGFLLFVGLYVGGFDLSHSTQSYAPEWDAIADRLALVVSAFGVLTYIMVLLEPKDRVHLRWLGRQLAKFKLLPWFNGLQAWMLSYIAVLLVAVPLLMRLHQVGQDMPVAMIAAAIGFLTRDIGIFILMQTRAGKRGGDYPALVCLFALYILLPSILNGLGMNDVLYLFHPLPNSVFLPGVLAPWIEALAVLGFAFTRLALPETQPARK